MTPPPIAPTMISGRRIFNLFSLFLVPLAFCLVGGCVSTAPQPQVEQLEHKEIRVCRAAVLPFVNETKYPQGDLIAYRIFHAALAASGLGDVSLEGDVRRLYRQLRLNPRQPPDNEQLRIIAQRLDVDAVITGRIVVMEERPHRDFKEPVLALELNLTPASGGHAVLTAYHRRSGEEYRKLMHFGLVTTMTRLTRLVADEIIANWRQKGLKPCVSP